MESLEQEHAKEWTSPEMALPSPATTTPILESMIPAVVSDDDDDDQNDNASTTKHDDDDDDTDQMCSHEAIEENEDSIKDVVNTAENHDVTVQTSRDDDGGTLREPESVPLFLASTNPEIASGNHHYQQQECQQQPVDVEESSGDEYSQSIDDGSHHSSSSISEQQQEEEDSSSSEEDEPGQPLDTDLDAPSIPVSDGPPAINPSSTMQPTTTATNYVYDADNDPELEAKNIILAVLTHGAKCQAQTRCPFPNCFESKSMIRHVSRCRNNHCTISYCANSKFVLCHASQIQTAILNLAKRNTLSISNCSSSSSSGNNLQNYASNVAMLQRAAAAAMAANPACPRIKRNRSFDMMPPRKLESIREETEEEGCDEFFDSVEDEEALSEIRTHPASQTINSGDGGNDTSNNNTAAMVGAPVIDYQWHVEYDDESESENTSGEDNDSSTLANNANDSQNVNANSNKESNEVIVETGIAADGESDTEPPDTITGTKWDITYESDSENNETLDAALNTVPKAIVPETEQDTITGTKWDITYESDSEQNESIDAAQNNPPADDAVLVETEPDTITGTKWDITYDSDSEKNDEQEKAVKNGATEKNEDQDTSKEGLTGEEVTPMPSKWDIEYSDDEGEEEEDDDDDTEERDINGIVASRVESDGRPSFLLSKTWQGSKSGYVFRTSIENGTGYHLDHCEKALPNKWANVEYSDDEDEDDESEEINTNDAVSKVEPESQTSLSPSETRQGSKPSVKIRSPVEQGTGYYLDHYTKPPSNNSANVVYSDDEEDVEEAERGNARTDYDSSGDEGYITAESVISSSSEEDEDDEMDASRKSLLMMEEEMTRLMDQCLDDIINIDKSDDDTKKAKTLTGQDDKGAPIRIEKEEKEGAVIDFSSSEEEELQPAPAPAPFPLLAPASTSSSYDPDMDCKFEHEEVMDASSGSATCLKAVQSPNVGNSQNLETSDCQNCDVIDREIVLLDKLETTLEQLDCLERTSDKANGNSETKYVLQHEKEEIFELIDHLRNDEPFRGDTTADCGLLIHGTSAEDRDVLMLFQNDTSEADVSEQSQPGNAQHSSTAHHSEGDTESADNEGSKNELHLLNSSEELPAAAAPKEAHSEGEDGCQDNCKRDIEAALDSSLGFKTERRESLTTESLDDSAKGMKNPKMSGSFMESSMSSFAHGLFFSKTNSTERRVYRNVRYRDVEGSLELSPEDLRFVSDGTDSTPEHLMLWNDITKLQISPDPWAFVKVILLDGTWHAFQFSRREIMETVRIDMKNHLRIHRSSVRKSAVNLEKNVEGDTKINGVLQPLPNDGEQLINQPGAAKSGNEISVFAPVKFQKFKGRLIVGKSNIKFEADKESEDFTDVPFCKTFLFSSIAKHQINPKSHTKALLKLVSPEGNAATFEFEDRQVLEKAKRTISKHRNAFGSSGTKVTPRNSTETDARIPSRYDNIVYRQKRGTVHLSWETFRFVAEDAGSTSCVVAWKEVKKPLVSPQSHKKAILKLVLNSGESPAFQLGSRSELLSIENEIITLLGNSGNPSKSSTATFRSNRACKEPVVNTAPNEASKQSLSSVKRETPSPPTNSSVAVIPGSSTQGGSETRLPNSIVAEANQHFSQQQRREKKPKKFVLGLVKKLIKVKK